MADKRYRLLVVDDLSDWRKTLGGLLREAGYEVNVAASLTEARASLKSAPFDLAIVDVRMDETDENNTEGLDLAAEIKRRWPAVKIVIITGYDTSDTVKRAMEPQDARQQRLVADFVTKTETDKLVQVVQRVLGQ